MSRLHFYGGLAILACFLLTCVILWSRPESDHGFLNDSGLPRVEYGNGTIEMRYYPKTSAQNIRRAMDSELSGEGYTVSERPEAYTQYIKDESSFTLIPREGGANPRLEIVYRRPANFVEYIFHPFWSH